MKEPHHGARTVSAPFMGAMDFGGEAPKAFTSRSSSSLEKPRASKNGGSGLPEVDTFAADRCPLEIIILAITPSENDEGAAKEAFLTGWEFSGVSKFHTPWVD